MKKFTSIAVALSAMLFAGNANAQTMIDWDENDQFTFYPEDFIGEGSISYDEDEACFVCDGSGPGKLMLNLDGKTIDFSEVASITVTGTVLTAEDEELTMGPGAWGGNDPLATIVINDAINGRINEWYGSRYSIDYKGLNNDGLTYYSLSTKVDSVYFTARAITVTEGEGDDAVTVVTGYTPGKVYIDGMVLTKLQERDPNAITIDMWHNWTAWDATAEIDTEKPFYGEDNVGKNMGAGWVLLGTGNVLGCEFVDLTPYVGIYAKGTPGLSLRLLFNRPDMEGGSAPITECNPVFDENGEFTFYFTELTQAEIEKFGAAYPYVHLNSVKTPWGLPEGVETVKVTKFNYIEDGGVSDIISDAAASDAPMFNIMGQKVNDSYKGLVIKNGKKFFNK